jgi:tRNA pseudouridine38-40 synthase
MKRNLKFYALNVEKKLETGEETMVRYKARIAYDGSQFYGFQRQPNVRTVQEELEKTLLKLNSFEETVVHGSGRTDAAVHALGQVVHFDLRERRKEEQLRFALDTQSPADISILEVEEVDSDWHSRYNNHEKTYKFRLDVGRSRSPFKRNFATYYPYTLDVEKMKSAIVKLIGTHDFTGFTAKGSSVEDKVRTIIVAEIIEKKEDEEIEFIFSGNGFLYKQIRNMVGTLLKIGNGKFPVSRIDEIIKKKDRNLAGPTAHPEGLYLVEVIYSGEES